MNSAARTAGLILAGMFVAGGIAVAQTSQDYRWKDGTGYTRPTDTPPALPSQALPAGVDRPNTSRPGSPPARLRLQQQGTDYLAWIDNPLHGPAEAVLRFQHRNGAGSQPDLPTTLRLPARRSVQAARITPAPSASGDFRLLLDAVPGQPGAVAEDHVYRLPFPHGRIRVDQGPGGTFSHHDLENLHAVDFALPEGTPILAAREGVVMQAEDGFETSGSERGEFAGRTNFVRILHRDGSMAVYAHLRHGGLLARPGQQVEAGQRIGISGNTGFSTAPHLHFAVQVNRGMQLESVPFRMSGPLGELRFAQTGESGDP